MIAFLILVAMVTILLMGGGYVEIPPAEMIGIIALSAAAGYAFLFVVGETIEHFTR